MRREQKLPLGDSHNMRTDKFVDMSSTLGNVASRLWVSRKRLSYSHEIIQD